MTDLFQRRVSRRSVLKTAASTAALAAIGMPSIVRAEDGPIRIGFPVPITGPFGAEAKDQVKSAELAVKQFNAAGGLSGRMAELLVRDDKLNPGEAATRTLELIEKDKVHFIVGALSSAVQLSVNEVTRARGVIYISISQSDTINEVKDFSRFTFHEAMNPQMTTGAVARQAFKKGQKVAYLAADYAYGHEMLAAFKRNAAPIGVDTVGEILHPFGAPDYSAFMPRLLSLKPDILCICNFGRDQANSIKQAVDFGLKDASRIVVPVLLHNQRLASSPDVFEGIVGGTNYYWGLEDTVPSAKAFNDAFRAANGGAIPTDYGTYGYTAIRSLLMAVKDAGGTDTDKVIAALEALKYDVAKGPQSYRKCDHQSVQSVFVVESKKKSEMKNDADLFKVLASEAGDPATLRSCESLGHKPS
ncbi:MAG: ABC transporter substrate-binding protein [Rhodopseudomonas sp.]|uniref:ABC transporter substrate-binding protein n=1 Tax=Rhodopseudomonas sp. TaxID=1078 RepID=UPI0018228CBB|nr:ABC transporter substrate-binding protein [Rhodopseudomonas sp.]NVN88314.1 ABC transporter substrate-binding protein [Rhodopseudomonas sp.]